MKLWKKYLKASMANDDIQVDHTGALNVEDIFYEDIYTIPCWLEKS